LKAGGNHDLAGHEIGHAGLRHEPGLNILRNVVVEDELDAVGRTVRGVSGVRLVFVRVRLGVGFVDLRIDRRAPRTLLIEEAMDLNQILAGEDKQMPVVEIHDIPIDVSAVPRVGGRRQPQVLGRG
jgi:hypothetical protein